MSAFFNVVLPVALIVAIGVIAGLKLPLDIASLTRITLYVFAPALAADSMYRAQVGAGAAIRIFVAYSAATLALYLLVRASHGPRAKPRKPPKASFRPRSSPTLAISVFVDRPGLGPVALDRAFVTFSAGAFFVFGLGPALISGGGVRAGIRTTLRLPMMWALLAGILLRVLGIQLPSGIADGLHLLAGARSPPCW